MELDYEDIIRKLKEKLDELPDVLGQNPPDEQEADAIVTQCETYVSDLRDYVDGLGLP